MEKKHTRHLRVKEKRFQVVGQSRLNAPDAHFSAATHTHTQRWVKEKANNGTNSCRPYSSVYSTLTAAGAGGAITSSVHSPQPILTTLRMYDCLLYICMCVCVWYILANLRDISYRTFVYRALLFPQKEHLNFLAITLPFLKPANQQMWRCVHYIHARI